MASRATTDPIEILLEMGVDLDNLSEEEDYLSALMEAIAIIEFQTRGKGDNRSAALREEVIKIRQSKRIPQARKTKISAESLKRQSSFARVGQKALPGTTRGGSLATISSRGGALVKKPGKEDKQPNILEKILAGVTSILETLDEQRKLNKDLADKQRKLQERKSRRAGEDKLESGIFKGIANQTKKILKPVEGLLSRILKFIGTILIGKVLMKIVNWMSDDDNKGKLEAIGNFLKNTWPALLAAYIIFGTSLGKFATGLIATVVKFSAKLVAKVIPQLLKALKSLGKAALANPLATGGALVVGAAAAGLINQATTQSNDPEAEQGRTQLDDTMSFGGTTGAPISSDMLGFEGGGQVPGYGNKDTIPAMLTPGEFVMSKSAVQQYGSETLNAMNFMGGGSGRPSFSNGIMYASSGGDVPAKKEPGGRNKTMSNEDGGFFGGLMNSMKNLLNDKNTSRNVKNNNSDLTNVQKKALQVLAKYESGAAGYDAVNQIGTKGGRGVMGFSGDIKQMPQYKGRSLTDFTIAEIKDLQYDDGKMSNQQWIDAGKLHAVGAYQFVGNTLPGVAQRAGIPDSAKFSPAVQDLMALQLIKERGISPWVGPSDKATAAERAIVEQARSIPIAYNKKSGGGAVTSFGGGSYTASSSSGSSGSSVSKSGGSDPTGLGFLAKIMKAQNKMMSGRSTATLGSASKLPSPPPPPIIAPPKVEVTNSTEQSASQKTPISETVSYVPVIPSAPRDMSKVTVLGIS